MLRFYRSGFGKVVLGLVVVGLGAGGALVGTELAASGAGVTLDHFWCYAAKGTGFKPVKVNLVTQSDPLGFNAVATTVSDHCNPVQKTATVNGKTTTVKIQNKDSHLLCWLISAPKLPNHALGVVNQFGTAKVTFGPPNKLCLPSWKSLSGPPKQPTAAPTNLSHFTCYPVLSIGWKLPPPAIAALLDQFSAPKTIKVKLGKPSMLCEATTKTVVSTKKTYKALDIKQNLLCFPVTPTAKAPAFVFDKNQFGSGKVAVLTTSQLCVPNTK